jgi:hypothetical protein
MIERAMVEAELTFRLTSDGGRAIPPGVLVGLQYRPHIVIGDPKQRESVLGEDRVATEKYLGVAFASGPRLVPNGEPIQVQMMLIYWPSLEYDTVQPGATFTLREGHRIVGHGRITRRWTEPWEPAAQR